jgi:hypothetical protein
MNNYETWHFPYLLVAPLSLLKSAQRLQQS